MSERWDTKQGTALLRTRLNQIAFYMHEGRNQKQIAELLDLTEKTIWKIKKAHPKFFEKVELSAKGKLDNPLKFDDSLNGYDAFCRVHAPDGYDYMRVNLPYYKGHIRLF